MSRTVTTPGGDVVEIIRDTDFEELARPEGAVSRLSPLFTAWANRKPVYGALWLHGPYLDPAGSAAAHLYKDATALGYKADLYALGPLMRANASALCITRDVKGKRCTRIQLTALPQTWVDRLAAEFPGPKVEPEPIPAEEPQPALEDRQEAAAVEERLGLVVEEEEQPHLRLTTPHPAQAGLDDWQPRPLELNIAQTVAMKLLDEVVKVIASGQAPTHQDFQRFNKLEGDLREVEHNLSMRLDENRSLRNKVSVLGDELRARKMEVDGLRQRLRIAEHNLQIAGSADTNRLVTQQVQAELERLMKAKPGPLRELASDRSA
jgi:hypothetical protein